MDEKMLTASLLLNQAIAEHKYIEEYKIAKKLNTQERIDSGARWVPMPKEFERTPSRTYIRDRMKIIRQLCLEISREI